MKKLSIEEKAKAYDMVVKEVKDFFEGRQKMYSDVEQTLEYLFPELKEENEDERIRKEIIDFVKSRGGFKGDWIAWLEKQAQKPADKVEHKFNVGDEIKTANEEPLTITKIDEKGYWSEDLFICGFDEECICDLVEQKPTDKIEPKFNIGDVIKRDMLTLKVGSINFKKEFYELVKDNKVIQCIPFAEQEGWELVANNTTESPKHCVMADSSYCPYFKKQKPAEWRITDEDMFRTAVWHIKNSISNGKPDTITKSDILDWFESLKERVQPKQEWSEEDEMILSDIIKDLVHPWNEYIPDRIEDEIKWLKNRLKFLRPKSQWKPSDEQIDALEKECIAHSNYELCRLLEQLKKLKG